MTTYTYQIEKKSIEKSLPSRTIDDAQLTQFLFEKGLSGWELVNTNSIQRNGDTIELILFF